MKLYLPIITFFLSLTITFTSHAQRTTEIGFTGGAIRFYPEAQRLGSNRNNSMDNGWGFSAGIFAEDHWKPKIHQVVEINYYNLSSDVFLQKNPEGPWAPNDGTGRQPVYGNYQNSSFNQLAVSGGVKLFLNNKLFIYPEFELMRALNKKVDIHRTTYNAKLGAGVNLELFDIILEYSYGLNNQRTVYDSSVPFATAHTNNFLQLKVQVPFYQF